MMNPVVVAALVVGASTLAAAQQAINAADLLFHEPSRIAEIDTEALKGQPARLAWSTDGSQLYLQMMDGQFGRPEAKLSHYVFDVASGERQEVSVQPEWASEYWTAKSGQASPDTPAFRIELTSETRIERTVSSPMGGDLARGGASGAGGGMVTGGNAAAAAYNRQRVPVHTMLLHGEVVGEFVNSVIVPGLTFGWGPPGSKLMAYSALRSGRVVVMDEKGTKQEIDGSTDAVLPAWSPDAGRLAWLQKDGRKKYVLQVVRVSTQ